MQYKQIFFYFGLALAALFILTIQIIWAETDSIFLGKLEYEQKNYQKALTYFDAAIKEKPNDIAFYYRANDLVNLGLKTQALLDYQQAYKLTDSAIMQDYCLKAMTSLSHNTIPALNRSTSAKSAAYSMKQNQIDQSLGTIELQSALDKVRIIGSGEITAQDFVLKQQVKLARMKQEAQQNAQSMQNASYYDAFGHKQPLYSPQQIQNYLDQRQEMEKSLQDSIDKGIEKHAEFSKERAQLTQESATNLANQLQNKSSSDGVKLDPLGTNLYVRNYDFTNDSNSLPKPPIKIPSTTQQKSPKD